MEEIVRRCVRRGALKLYDLGARLKERMYQLRANPQRGNPDEQIANQPVQTSATDSFVGHRRNMAGSAFAITIIGHLDSVNKCGACHAYLDQITSRSIVCQSCCAVSSDMQ